MLSVAIWLVWAGCALWCLHSFWRRQARKARVRPTPGQPADRPSFWGVAKCVGLGLAVLSFPVLVYRVVLEYCLNPDRLCGDAVKGAVRFLTYLGGQWFGDGKFFFTDPGVINVLFILLLLPLAIPILVYVLRWVKEFLARK
jgi:hypothetical protein